MVAVRDAVDRLITDVYAGKLHPKIAAGLAPLLQLQLRALEATDTEGRLCKLERLVAKREQQRSKSTRGKSPDKTAASIGFFNGPVAARDSQKETGSAEVPKQQEAAGVTENEASSAEPCAPEPGSQQYTSELQAQAPSDSEVGLRIQDATARASQAELDEQEQGENREIARIQDAEGRALEQCKSELPISEVEAQAPSNPAALEPTTKTAEPREKDAEQRLPAGPQQAPAESGETAATTSATKNDQEMLEELLNEAREAWMTGKLDLMSRREK